MPYPNQHAARVRNPDLFEPDSFRSKAIADGITLILGKLKGQADSAAMTVQSYRFDSGKFTPEEAKAWLEKHNVKPTSFEPAVKESEESESFLPLLYQQKMHESAGNILEQVEPAGKTWRVVLIKAGMSLNDRYYGVECLQEALPLFEGVNAYAYDNKGTFDHSYSTPNQFPRSIVGFYDNITWDENQEAITADFHITASWLQELLKKSWDAGKKDMLGFSIDGMGENIDAIRDGQHCLECQHLTAIEEVTVVTDPAAGGKLLRMVASTWDTTYINNLPDSCFAYIEPGGKKDAEGKTVPRSLRHLPYMDSSGKVDMPHLRNALAQLPKTNIPEEAKKSAQAMLDKAMMVHKKAQEANMLETLIARLKEMKVIAEDADTSTMTVEEAIGKFEEAVRASAGSKEAPKTAASEAMTALLEQIKGELAASQKLREEQIAATAKSEEAAKVQESNNRLEAFLSTDTAMPIPSKERVRESLKGKVYSEEEMNATIKAEKDYVGRLTESGVKGLGDQRADISAGDEQADKFQVMMDSVFDLAPAGEKEKRIRESLGAIPPSLRRAYSIICDDPEITGFYGGGMGKTRRLTEAISTDFTYILANTLNRFLLSQLDSMTTYPWQDWLDTRNLVDLKEVQPVRLGSLNIYRPYSESNSDDNITEQGVPADEKAAYSPTTYIGMIRLSRKSIINDDLGAFKANASEMGLAGQGTLIQEIFKALLGVSAGVINAASMYDSVALYDAAHNNKQTTSFSYAALWTLRNLLTRQFSTGYASTIAANMTDTTTETLTMATGTGKHFPVGTAFQIGSEKLYVKVQSTDSITAVRGFMGTTAATHNSGDAATIVIRQLNNQLGWLLVPSGTALEQQAETYANSDKAPDGAQNDTNPLFKKFIPVPVDPILLLGDQTNYYGIGNGPGVKGGEVGFFGGRTPTLILQDQPPMGQVFAGELIRIKGRFEFGVKITNYRRFAAGLVTG